jgi:hypothetical protein
LVEVLGWVEGRSEVTIEVKGVRRSAERGGCILTSALLVTPPSCRFSHLLEANLQDPISLINDEYLKVAVVEVLGVLEVIEETARGRDEDVYALAEPVEGEERKRLAI